MLGTRWVASFTLFSWQVLSVLVLACLSVAQAGRVLVLDDGEDGEYASVHMSSLTGIAISLLLKPIPGFPVEQRGCVLRSTPGVTRSLSQAREDGTSLSHSFDFHSVLNFT